MAVYQPNIPWSQNEPEAAPAVPNPAGTPAPYVDPYQYQPGPMEQQAMDYWQKQTEQPFETPEQAAMRRGIYAAGMTPDATARLEEGMGQYMRGGQSGAGREFIGQTVAGYEGAMRQGLTQSELDASRMGADYRLNLVGQGTNIAGMAAGANLGRQQFQYGQLTDAQSKEYYDWQEQQRLAEEQKYKDMLDKLYGTGGGGFSSAASTSTYSPVGTIGGGYG